MPFTVKIPKVEKPGQDNGTFIQDTTTIQTPKTPYQQNLSQPVEEKWYTGNQPTTRETLGQILRITQDDPERGKKLQSNFETLMTDKTSMFWSPYSQPTNPAVAKLNELGVDTVNSDWYDQTQYLNDYLTYNGNTNAPSSPKKNDVMGNIAYQRNQYAKGMEQTNKALQECEALKEEINFLVGWGDRNYSDDQIIEYLYGADGSNFKKKYPTLAAMDESMEPGHNLLELNEAVPYSKDWVYGNIWAARNDGGTGNIYQDMAWSALGEGNVWQENKDISARLAQGTDTYAPYTVGSTTDDVCMYFGVPSYDKQYLMEHRPDGTDKTEADMWNKAWDAATFTEDAKAEAEKFDARLDRKLENATNPDDVMKSVDRWLDEEYTNLNKLDKSTEKINALVDTSEAINFSRYDILQKVNAKCAENASRLNGGETMEKNGMSAGSEQAAEADKAGDQKVTEAADLVTDPTSAEQNVLNNTPSTWFDRVYQTFLDTRNPLALAKKNESETVTNYANGTITAVEDIMSNTKAQQQLDALNNTNENRVNRCDEIRDGFSAGTGMFSFLYDIEDGPTVKRGDADVPNSRYAPALVELYETVTGESALDGDGAIRPGVIEEAEKYYDYIVNGNRTYEEDEEIPWLLDDYTETKQSLEAEIERTAGASQKHKWSSLAMNARIAAYEAAGMDATGLKTGKAVANSLYFFMEYDATNWTNLNRYEAMVQGIEDGEEYEAVKAEAIKGNAQIQEELANCLFIKDYLTENNIDVPDDVQNNLDRHIAKLQRDQEDFNFFILRENPDFKEKAEEGRKLEEADYKQRILDNPDEAPEYVDAPYGLKSAEFYDLMNDAEKDTYYYIYATEGQDEAIRYVASYLSDNTYGVLQTRYREQLQKQAGEEVNSGILGAAWANAKAILSAPLSGVNSLTYTLGTLISGEEFNPNNKALALGQYANAVNAETQRALNDPKNIKSPFLRELASGAYEIGYNRLRSMANAAAFGGVLGDLTSSAILNEIFAALPMASDAMGTAIANAKDKGAEDWQAYAIGGVTLLAESVTEGLTYGNIKEAFQGSEDHVARSVKDLLKTWLTSSGVEEMIGESANDIIENIADETILGALSEHEANVNKYIEELGLDPNNPVDRDKAEELARKDELNGVLHTALISYLSPGLDVFTGGITDAVRDFHNIRTATGNLQKQGFNVSMTDVRKDYMKWKDNEIKNAQNATPKQTEQQEQAQAPQTEQTETEQAEAPVENAEAQATENVAPVEETVTAPAEEAKQPSTADMAFLNDLGRLDAVTNSDTSTQAGAIGALFGGETEAQQDTARAAAANITNLFGSMKEAVNGIKNIITGAHIGFTDQGMVKSAIRTASLSPSSAAAQMMQSEAFQNASPIEQAQMLASTVESDFANEAVQNEIDKATHENRVAEAEADLIRNGALDAVKTLKASWEKAQENTRMAKESLDEKQAELQAKGDALQAATEEFNQDPSADNQHALDRASGELEKADTVAQEYEQHLDNIQRAEADAKQKYNDAYESTMRDIRQQAEATIADQNRQRAERDAAIAEQQRIAAEQEAQAQAEEDQRSGKKAEDDTVAFAEDWANKLNVTGDERDSFIRRVIDRQAENTLGQIDMSGKLTNAEGYLAIMAFARKTGLKFQMADNLPNGVRGKYENGVIYLNSDMVNNGTITVGQALVEAALHEIPHAMESTQNYDAYAQAAIDYLYGSGENFNKEQYDKDIADKIKSYQKINASLSEEQARQEIVADFARTHLADKDVIQRFMDAGLGGRMRNALHNINQALKNFIGRLAGEDRTQAEYLRKAERAYQKALNELARQEGKHEANEGKYSFTEVVQNDADYMTDVQNGDMEDAQAIVDEAAQAAGYTIKAYHGTPDSGRFNIFDAKKLSNRTLSSQVGQGFYFTTNKDQAAVYTSRHDIYGNTHRGENPYLFEGYLNIQNPIEVGNDTHNLSYDEIRNIIGAGGYQWAIDHEVSYLVQNTTLDGHTYTAQEIKEMSDEEKLDLAARYLYEQGDKEALQNMVRFYSYDNQASLLDAMKEYTNYDGVHWEFQKGNDIYVTFDSSQFKDSAPVVYDDNGNIIPPFERFNLNNPDIRYSHEGDITDADIDQQLAKAGLIPKQDKIARPLEGQNPTLTTSIGNGQRQFSTPGGMLTDSDEIDRFAKAYVLNQPAYVTDSNPEQIDRAIKWIRSNRATPNSDGFYESFQKAMSKDFDYRSADGQARMVALMGMAVAKNNDVMAQSALLDNYARQGTDLGRALQARKLFRLMSAEGRQMALHRMLERTADETNTPNLKFSDWIYQAAADATQEGDFEKVYNAAAAELADQLPASWADKFRGWRMLSMLGNPRTHIRNILGNLMFVPMVGIKNKIAALGEIVTGVKQGERTKTLGLASKEARSFASNYVDKVSAELKGEAKYDDRSAVKQQQKTWGTGKSVLSKTLGRLLQMASDANSYALEWEDWLFLKGHFKRALAGYMTANKLTAEDMTGDTLQKAQQYAILEAHKATYRDANSVATALNNFAKAAKGTRFESGAKALQFAVDAILPFKKTPANILRRGIEYSPVGALASLRDIKALVETNRYMALSEEEKQKVAAPKRQVTPAQFIDKISSGLTGMGAMVLGTIFGLFGAANAGFDDKEPEDRLKKLKGEQEYGVNPVKFINKLFGAELLGEDVTYTMDWAAPFSMPFFVGVAVANEMQKEHEEDEDIAMRIVNSALGITEPVFNLSMLEGINSLFNISQYDKASPIAQLVTKVATNYGSSYVPTLLGQFARWKDPTRRANFVQSGSKPYNIYSTIEQVQNKIPGLSETNIPYRNAYGEAEQNSHPLETFFAPWYSKQIRSDDITNEIESVFNTMLYDHSNLIPTNPDKNFKAGGEPYKPTDKEYEQMQITTGETYVNLMNDLIHNEAYQIANPDTKAAMIEDASAYAEIKGKQTLAGDNVKLESWMQKGENSGDMVDAIVKKEIEANKEAYVEGFNEELYKLLDRDDIDNAKAIIYNLKVNMNVDEDLIRKQVSNYYRPLYYEAYIRDDDGAMDRIKDILSDFEIGYGKSTWSSWNNAAKKIKYAGEYDNEDEEETDETNWLNLP